MNWLDCELIYLERFVQKLQRILDRQVFGLCPPEQMHTKRAYARAGVATLLAVKSILLKATYPA
jgi:ribosomal protein S18